MRYIVCGWTFKEFYNCPVCLELLKELFLMECCDHHFCSKCINSIQLQKNECPICKESPSQESLLNASNDREINEAEVYCLLQTQGS